MGFLTILVFMLSSHSSEKVTLSISILLALTLFFLLLLDIMPPTSLVVPLFGKYLVFTITMLSLSILFTIYILNIHHRTPELHKAMPSYIRTIFLKNLPKILFFKNLMNEYNKYENEKFKKKFKLALKSSMESLESLKRVYFHKNLILAQKAVVPMHNKNRFKVKAYNGSKLLTTFENSDTGPRGRTEALKKLNPLTEASTNAISSNELNDLILENIKYLRNITNSIKRDYKKKTVKFFFYFYFSVLATYSIYNYRYSFRFKKNGSYLLMC